MSVFQLRPPCGVLVARELTEAQLVATVPAVATTRSVKGAGWTWYRIPRFREAQVEVDIALAFHARTLRIVGIADVDDRFGNQRDDASGASERLRAASIGAWLQDKGYRPGKYPWGQISVDYDPRSGIGAATVRFAP